MGPVNIHPWKKITINISPATSRVSSIPMNQGNNNYKKTLAD
jgi:hypothetical protein